MAAVPRSIAPGTSSANVARYKASGIVRGASPTVSNAATNAGTGASTRSARSLLRAYEKKQISNMPIGSARAAGSSIAVPFITEHSRSHRDGQSAAAPTAAVAKIQAAASRLRAPEVSLHDGERRSNAVKLWADRQSFGSKPGPRRRLRAGLRL